MGRRGRERFFLGGRVFRRLVGNWLGFEEVFSSFE